MEFPYYKVLDFPKHQKRNRLLPWIWLGIFNPTKIEKIVYPLGLIDSGSDLTLIHYELGKELGIDIEKGIKKEVVGLGGGQITGYLHKIGFKIEDLKGKCEPFIYEDSVLFTYEGFPKSFPQQTAIFGTVGFFRNLGVAFKYPDCIFIENRDSFVRNSL